MTTAIKHRAIFCRDESGEPAVYCGHTDDMDDLKRGIACVVVGQLSDLLDGTALDDECEFTFEAKEMTDEEIAALPDC